MSGDTNFVLTHLGELEALAEEILTEKQQIVDLDRKRNQSREAVRALKNQTEFPSNQKSKKEVKTWVGFGNTFIKLPAKNVKTMLTEDQKKLDEEINELRNGLKPKVAKLREMEGQEEKKGFDLKAMSRDEMKAVYHPTGFQGNT
ncbi:p53 and DNA damage-regulated protein 1 [Strongylocentrotus purpuratus]|uniref:P53 and DNA damage-regulated protein 1 n=1 Tax=Strongylocentrotus purpuratus TaxID=7668 RepID=A0A7M7N864_STRPU|nr:p53 and DNA damage-regulated protein 1 [Strongylocentrotus purpuratus]